MGWIKEDIVHVCLEKCLSRIQEIKAAMQIAQDAILNDTKSSMGDKYETSREMAQQELSRLQNQLKQAESDADKVKNLNLKPSNIVTVGSIVKTDQFDYFIAISIGPLKIGNQTIMVISKESPIGQILLSKEIGDSVAFNGKSLDIKDIL